MTTAKSLGGGLPLGAVVGKAENDGRAPCGRAWAAPTAATPVSCAAALAVLEYVEEEDLCAKATRVGEMARGPFSRPWPRSTPVIGEVRGLGAMLALELVRDQKDQGARRRRGQEAGGLLPPEMGLIAPELRPLRANIIPHPHAPWSITDEQLGRGPGHLGKGLGPGRRQVSEAIRPQNKRGLETPPGPVVR